MGFSRQECWSGLPSPSPVDHILSELSNMTHLSWVALHGMAHSFSELHKAVIHVSLAFCGCGFHSGGHKTEALISSVCPLMDEDKRFVQASWWEGLTVGKAGSCFSGQGQASQIFNPIFCWSVGLCSLPVVWPEVAQSWSLQSLWWAICSMVKLTATSSKRAYVEALRLPGLLLLVLLPPQHATVNPHLSWRLPHTQGKIGSVSCKVTSWMWELDHKEGWCQRTDAF